MEEDIKKRVEKAIADRVFPGCVIGVYVNSKTTFLPYGSLTYSENSSKVKTNTVYDLASVTKMIPASSLLLSLIDKGQISLDDKVIDYLPAFNGHKGKDRVLVKHLLTYTLDIDVPSTTSLKNREAEEIIEVILEAPLKAKPGSRFLYTDSTALITGLLLNKVSGKSLDTFAREYFFEPLKMENTTFNPKKKFDLQNIAPTEEDPWRGRLVRGDVHDETSYVLQKEGYYIGISGLFSTAPDLMIFMKMLLNEGSYNGKEFFSENIVKEMHTNQIDPKLGEVGLGWDLNSKYKMGDLSSDSIFGHSGFTGSIVLCDPIQKVVIVMLSNRTFPTRPANSDAINKVRHDIADIIFKYKRNGSR